MTLNLLTLLDQENWLPHHGKILFGFQIVDGISIKFCFYVIVDFISNITIFLIIHHLHSNTSI